jgi:hypothetical protein
MLWNLSDMIEWRGLTEQLTSLFISFSSDWLDPQFFSLRCKKLCLVQTFRSKTEIYHVIYKANP